MLTAILHHYSGYRPLCRTGTICPGCGHSHWQIGRLSAECAFCGTALPLAPVERVAAPAERVPAWALRP